ncbi:P-loop NTPase fold protein [Vibrio vulnificus]|uniref:P-loop NTPase fold protein n=1 Tax=Vibrio vulnificus TaxID=672 RepID=UPI003EDB371C
MTSTITLDLSLPLTGSQIDNSQLLQQDALKQIETLFESIKKQTVTNNVNDEFNPTRCNNTLFIHGERGAGKTTFLRGLLNHYRHDENHKTICPIPLIDPTLSSTHQHILVDIVAKFANLMENRLSKCCNAEKFEAFRSKLEDIAQGLQLLRDTKTKNQYDASWFLDKAINKATSGFALEKGLHSLIDVMANELNVELFIIAIDDVDTKTNKANEVLETLRCYLTHPRLVILISGDLKLYSHIVKTSKKNELSAQNGDGSEQLVDHLEQQYLTKILPVEQRVNLKRLSEIVKNNTIFVKHKALSKDIELIELIEVIFSSSLNINKQHLKSHLDFIINQPVRSVLQLVKSLLDSKCDNYSSNSLKQAIYHNFIGSLVAENLQLENLMNNNPHMNTIGFELFKLLENHGELETGFYARPDSSYDQSGFNAAKLYLSATISSLFGSSKEKSRISNGIKTMLTGGAAANVFSTYVAGKLEQNANIQNYLDYIGLSRNENITSLAAHLSPIILNHLTTTNNKAIASGVVRTPRRISDRSFDTDIFSKIISLEEESRLRTSSIDNLAKERTLTSFADYVAIKTILISAHKAQTTTEGRDYISVYALLASLSELLSESEGYDNSNLLAGLCSIPTYTYPHFLQGSTKGDEDDIEDYDGNYIDESNSTHLDRLESILEKWRITSLQLNTKFSSLLIGKVWTRLFYSLNQISDKAKSPCAYPEGKADIVLGELFARFVWAIINASLIEECRYRIDTDRDQSNFIRSAKNISSSSNELVVNLSSILKSNVKFKDDLPLTYSLISCPLLWPFLGDTSISDNVKSIIQQSCEGDTQQAMLSDFQDISEIKNPAKLFISTLPIIGCFRSNK